MGLFGKKKKEKVTVPVQERPATKKLKATAELTSEIDPNFAVIGEITYMESDEVII